jgi:nanoRNase/pAp phosphatase (c-di-AMP/oligoRNAs hydrolase)
VNVRDVAAVWDGGGHRNAAGCTIPGTDAEVRAAVVAEMKRVIDAADPPAGGVSG